MPWPLSQDYNEAIQTPRISFADEELRGGEAVTNALGMPMPRSGNFADVYEFTGASGSKWAVKCFTREVAGLRERYHEISLCLQKAKLPFTVDFQYLPQGIRIHGQWCPILKMHWVEGLLLNEFIRANLDKSKTLEGLSDVWVRMALWLREAGIAHADLQHGNVILVPGSKATSLAVKLIDYDGMFVPALAGKPSGEVGHPNFQHPERLQKSTYDAEVDRLPLLAVTCALRALVVGGKTLWDKYDNGDNLLFREQDLSNPGASALLKELWNLDDDGVHDLVGHLAIGLASTHEFVPHVSDLIQGNGPAPLSAAQEGWVVSLFGAGAIKRPVSAGAAPSQATAVRVAAEPVGQFGREREAFAEQGKGPAPKRKTQPARVGGRRDDDLGVPHGPSVVERKKLRLIGGSIAAAIALVAVTAWLMTLGEKRELNGEAIVQLDPNGKIRSNDEASPNGVSNPKDLSKPKATASANPDRTDPASTSISNPTTDLVAKTSHANQLTVIEPQEIKLIKNEAIFSMFRTNKSDELLLFSAVRYKLWNPETGDMRVVEQLKNPNRRSSVACVAITRDGAKFFGAAISESAITVRNLRSLAPEKEIDVEAAGISHFVLSPDGKTLVAGSLNGSVRVWDALNYKEIALLIENKKATSQNLAISPDSRTLFTSCTDGTTCLWDLESRKQLVSVKLAPVFSPMFTPDATHIVGISSSKLVFLDSQTLKVASSHSDHGNLSGLQFTPDGRRLLSYGQDNMLRLWDWINKKVTRLYLGHTGPVNCAVCTADGKWIYSCDTGVNGCTVYRWPLADDLVALGKKPAPNTSSNTPANTLPLVVWESRYFPMDLPYCTLAPTFDPKRILIAGSWLKACNPETGADRYFGSRKGGNLLATLAPTPDGKKFYSATMDDPTITLWDAASAKAEGQLVGHKGAIWKIALSPDGNSLVSSGMDGTIRLWDAKKLSEIRVLVEEKKFTQAALAISPDGAEVFASCTNGKAYLWDLKTGEQLLTTPFQYQPAATYAPDGSHIVTAGFSAVNVLNRQTLNVESSHSGHPSVTGISFTPGGNLLSFGQDHMLRLWNWKTKKVACIFLGHAGPISSAVCSADGKWIYSCSHFSERSVRQWPLAEDMLALAKNPSVVEPAPKKDPDPKVPAAKKPVPSNPLEIVKEARQFKFPSGQPFYSVHRTNKSKELLLGSGRFKLWNPDAGDVRSYDHPNGSRGGRSISHAALTQDGSKFFGAALSDKDIILWDFRSPKPVGKLEGHVKPITALVMSPTGKTLVSGSEDSTVRFWDAKLLREVNKLQLPASPITALALSFNGRQVFYANRTNCCIVELDDTSQGVNRGLAGITGAAFSRDGAAVLAVTPQAIVELDATTPLRTIAEHKGHANARNVLFTPNGKSFLTFGYDKNICLWDWQSRTIIKSFEGHESEVADIVCSADGKWLYSCGRDRTIRIWPLAAEVKGADKKTK
ncbi:MAG: hypothetical protein HY040_17460 [Planctomycetes bacterium]|nr:hypothetical protein [Planctomycetota bacterium]